MRYELSITSTPPERWWGPAINHGTDMPLGGEAKYQADLFGTNYGNQVNPLLVSTEGRWVFSHAPFAVDARGADISITSPGAVETGSGGSTLRDAFCAARDRFFPPSGVLPEPLLFTQPQWNTWIELTYNQNQDDIVAYAERIVAEGHGAGVLMIDDTWQEDYGVWNFHPARFSDPKAMMGRLHELGFQVMLWIVPFVSPDSPVGRQLEKRGHVVMDATSPGDEGNAASIFRWWNGASSSLDLTNPEAVAWFKGELDRLQNEYGADGFKLDAGDAPSYNREGLVYHTPPVTPNDICEAWGRIGLDYPLNEYRACYKLAGQGLAQRLRDKKHNWEDLQTLVPCGIQSGLMGYAFVCPDMIGGGEFGSFLKIDAIDQDLLVRSAQASALFPMMQFSVAPWRVLDAEHQEACLAVSRLHTELGDEILELAKRASGDGEPILRSMEYVFPHQGFVEVMDQFLLGDEILVAPVVEKGAVGRTVHFPAGTWHGDDGSTVEGPGVEQISAPIDRLPWYRKS